MRMHDPSWHDPVSPLFSSPQSSTLRALSGGLFPFFPIFFFPWKISDSGKIVSVGLLQRQPCRRHADAFPLKGRQWFRTDLVGSGFSYPLRDTRNALA